MRGSEISRGLSYPPHELGGNSRYPSVQALHLVDRELFVFPANGETWSAGMKNWATTDAAQVRAWHEINPGNDWRVRAMPGDGLWILDCPRIFDREMAERDMGPLPRTWTVTRPSGGTHFWFKAHPSDPKLATGKPFLGCRAALKTSAPIPGSVHVKSGERYAWSPGLAPGQIDLAPLPHDWLLLLPKRGPTSITAVPLRRPEWSARSGRTVAK